MEKLSKLRPIFSGGTVTAGNASGRNDGACAVLIMALSRKGLTKQAESALRKAIQLDPNFPEAHQNLAIVYATQKPPFIELSRWHYKKSLDMGQPKNAELEKILEKETAAAAKAADKPADKPEK